MTHDNMTHDTSSNLQFYQLHCSAPTQVKRKRWCNQAGLSNPDADSSGSLILHDPHQHFPMSLYCFFQYCYCQDGRSCWGDRTRRIIPSGVWCELCACTTTRAAWLSHRWGVPYFRISSCYADFRWWGFIHTFYEILLFVPTLIACGVLFIIHHEHFYYLTSFFLPPSI